MGHVPTLNPAQRGKFRSRLLRWFQQHQRPLPWRKDCDAYRVWVSEIMLQQTRVAAVLEHYGRFLERFPNVHALAAAPLEEVLSAWSGLGYYRRARGIHAAAREIVSHYGGELPRTAAGLIKLPGFGRYTAAAVASIAFGEPCAVLDGNVERVLRRLLGAANNDSGWSTSSLWQQAEMLLSHRSPGNFNQAMMELGALVCLPGEPRCGACPVSDWCATRGSGKPGPRTERRTAEAVVLVARKNGSIFLVQRPESVSVMPGLWELPQPQKGSEEKQRPLMKLRHAIMNTDYRVEVVSGGAPRSTKGRWVAEKEASLLPLTGLTRKILRRLPEAAPESRKK